MTPADLADAILRAQRHHIGTWQGDIDPAKPHHCSCGATFAAQAENDAHRRQVVVDIIDRATESPS